MALCVVVCVHLCECVQGVFCFDVHLEHQSAGQPQSVVVPRPDDGDGVLDKGGAVDDSGDPLQRQASLAPSGSGLDQRQLLVHGPAGSGKSWSIRLHKLFAQKKSLR